LNTEEEKSKGDRDSYPNTLNGSSEHASESMLQKVKRKKLNLSEEEKLAKKRKRNREDTKKFRKRKKIYYQLMKEENETLKAENEKLKEEIKKLKENHKELEEKIEFKNEVCEILSQILNREYIPNIIKSSESSDEIYKNTNVLHGQNGIFSFDTPVEDEQEDMSEKKVPEGSRRPSIEEKKDSHYEEGSIMENISDIEEGQGVDNITKSQKTISGLPSSIT